MRKQRLQVCMALALVMGAMPACARGTEPLSDIAARQRAPQAAAAQTSPLKITLTRSKIITTDGREVAVPAEFAKPGDILEDTATYANVSNTMLTVSEATLPVPLNTILQVGSLRPAGARASMDGRTFESVPIKRRVQQSGAGPVETDVDPAAYRFLRWSPGAIGPGKAVAFSARFRVIGEIAGPVKAKD